MKHTYIKPLSTSFGIRIQSPLMDTSVTVNRTGNGIQTNEDLGGTSDFNRSKGDVKWGEW